MDNDDMQVGRVLTRREVLTLFGAAAATMLVACAPGPGVATAPTPVVGTAQPTAESAALPACIVRPQQTEGPYFVDEKLERSDIRSDPSDGSVKAGVPLALTFRVSQVGSGSCVPLANALVDVWHCDALGVYSDVRDANTGATVGKKFLRGYQQTDANGSARFTTIYPGWYPGRTVHIHFKIRSQAGGRAQEFTSQLYFDDALSDEVHAQQPYASKGQRTLRNSGDGIFRDGGSQLLLQTARAAQGYAANFDIGLQLA